MGKIEVIVIFIHDSTRSSFAYLPIQNYA